VPLRPIVRLALVRQFVSAYAAASLKDGVIDWMLDGNMDTPSMGAVLRLVWDELREKEFNL